MLIKQEYMHLDSFIGKYKIQSILPNRDFLAKKSEQQNNNHQIYKFIICQCSNQFYIEEDQIQKINKQTNLVLPSQTLQINNKKQFYFSFKIKKSLTLAQQVPQIDYKSEIYCLTILYSFVNKIINPLTKLTTLNIFQILKKDNIWVDQQNSYLLLVPRQKLQRQNTNKSSRRVQRSSQKTILFPFTQINQKKILKITAEIFWQIFFKQKLLNYSQLLNRTFLKQLLLSMYKSETTLFQLQTILQDKNQRKKFMSSKRKSFYCVSNSPQNSSQKKNFLLDTLNLDDQILESQIMLKPYNKKKSYLISRKMSPPLKQRNQIQKRINFQFKKDYVPPSFTRKSLNKKRNSMFKHNFNNSSLQQSESNFGQSLYVQSNKKRSSKSGRKYKKINFDDLLFEERQKSNSKIIARTIDVQKIGKQVKKNRYFEEEQLQNENEKKQNNFKPKSKTIDVSFQPSKFNENAHQQYNEKTHKKVQRKRLIDQVNQIDELIQRQRNSKNNNQILSRSQQKALNKFKNQMKSVQKQTNLSSVNSRSIDDRNFRINFERKVNQKELKREQKSSRYNKEQNRQNDQIEQTSFQKLKLVLKSNSLHKKQSSQQIKEKQQKQKFYNQDFNRIRNSQDLIDENSERITLNKEQMRDNQIKNIYGLNSQDKKQEKEQLQHQLVVKVNKQIVEPVKNDNQREIDFERFENNSYKNQQLQKLRVRDFIKQQQNNDNIKQDNSLENKVGYLQQSNKPNHQNNHFSKQNQKNIKYDLDQSIKKKVLNNKKAQIQSQFFRNSNIEQTNFDQVKPIDTYLKPKTQQKQRKKTQQKQRKNSEQLKQQIINKNFFTTKEKEQISIQKPPLPIKKVKPVQSYDNDQIQQIVLKPTKQEKKETESNNDKILNKKVNSQSSDKKIQKRQQNNQQQQNSQVNKRVHTNQSSIASSGGPKKSMNKIVNQYITMINKMGEAVAKTAKMSKKLSQIQWYVGIFFIYKRFLYQRKKIQKYLKENIPKLTRYDELDLAQWKIYINSQQKQNVYQKIMQDNKNIQQSIIKMHKRLISRPNVSEKVKMIANLGQRTYEQSKIAVQYIVEQYDSIVQKGLLQDEEVFIHICEMLNSCLILTQLDKKCEQKQSLAKMVTIRRTAEQLQSIANLVFDLYDDDS